MSNVHSIEQLRFAKRADAIVEMFESDDGIEEFLKTVAGVTIKMLAKHIPEEDRKLTNALTVLQLHDSGVLACLKHVEEWEDDITPQFMGD